MNIQRKLIAAMSLCAIVAVPNIASAASVSGQGTWETTLLARDLDGNLTTAEAYYDTVLGITWLADANFAQTSGYDSDGIMTWESALVWVSGLRIGDIAGWRLPKNVPLSGNSYNVISSDNGSTDHGYNISAPSTLYAYSHASEMAYLYYNTLGNIGARALDGTPQCDVGGGRSDCLTNSGPFATIFPAYFSSPYPDYPNGYWLFAFGIGYQYWTANGVAYVWAVHDGDVGVAIPSAVPVPAAAWLLGSGLLGMIGFARKK